MSMMDYNGEEGRQMKQKKTKTEKNLVLVENNSEMPVINAGPINEATLFERIAAIIDSRKSRIESHVNAELTSMYWEVGALINSAILDGGRGEYGKQILATLSPKLAARYGHGFKVTNIYRMMRFAEKFNDPEILATVLPKLSRSHIVELLPLKTQEARLYYAKDVAERKYGARELRHQISHKAYERREIANTELSEQSAVPFNIAAIHL